MCGQYIYIETTSEFLINFLLTGFPASFDFFGGEGGGGNVEQMILNSNENIRTQILTNTKLNSTTFLENSKFLQDKKNNIYITLYLACLYQHIEDIIRWRKDMNFIFEW